jgi:uncharacterized protein YndB with AHSA1/START domain
MTTANKVGETTFTTPSDREIAMTRVFDAPRGLVWDAYTNPEHVPHWFGPRGWTLPVCEIDLRAGGAWRFVMHGPDGTDMGMSGVYQEITPARAARLHRVVRRLPGRIASVCGNDGDGEIR